jgi:cytochrome c-type biogenesis protein
MNRAARRWTLALSAGLAACGTACGSDGGRRVPVAVGESAPAYAAQRMDGAAVALADLRGEVVLLNIWATWCKPCREEIPALEVLHQAHAARGLVVTGVSIDAHDDTASIAAFARELGASYPLWRDPDDRVSSTFLAIGVPATYLIDRDGVLRWRHMGAVKADDPALLAALDSALTRAPRGS